MDDVSFYVTANDGLHLTVFVVVHDWDGPVPFEIPDDEELRARLDDDDVVAINDGSAWHTLIRVPLPWKEADENDARWQIMRTWKHDGPGIAERMRSLAQHAPFLDLQFTATKQLVNNLKDRNPNRNVRGERKPRGNRR